MKIEEAIGYLRVLAGKYGNVDVYFDCPKCGSSYTPNTVGTAAVHISPEKKLEETKS